MKTLLTAAALMVLAACPAIAAPPVFALVMVKDCEPGDPQTHYNAGDMVLPFCLTGAPFLTAPDIITANAVTVAPERLRAFGLNNPHVLHWKLTDDAARRLTSLSRENRGES